MPNLTGEKLAAGFMKIRAEIPIIPCTGFSQQMPERRAKELDIKISYLKTYPEEHVG